MEHVKQHHTRYRVSSTMGKWVVRALRPGQKPRLVAIWNTWGEAMSDVHRRFK